MSPKLTSRRTFYLPLQVLELLSKSLLALLPFPVLLCRIPALVVPLPILQVTWARHTCSSSSPSSQSVLPTPNASPPIDSGCFLALLPLPTSGRPCGEGAARILVSIARFLVSTGYSPSLVVSSLPDSDLATPLDQLAPLSPDSPSAVTRSLTPAPVSPRAGCPTAASVLH